MTPPRNWLGAACRALMLGAVWAGPALAAPPESQAFVPYSYVDPLSRLEVFRCLVPKGWKVEGKVKWSANPALPVQSRFRFHDPGSVAEVNLFPTQAFFWTDNATFLGTNPPGTLRFNTLVARPVDLDAAFDRLLVPSIRKGAAGLSVGDRKRLPDLARLAAGDPTPGVRASAQAGKVRLAYQERGTAIEEDLFASVANFRIDLPGSAMSRPYFIDYWYVDHVFSFRAEKGQLAARSKTFQTVILSMKVNPKWFAKVVHTKEALAQAFARSTRAIGDIGTTVASAGTNLREEQMRDWGRRQSIQDRVVQAQSDGIRGVDRFVDPHSGNEVELPSGYGRAWANNLGEYIVTESPSYNPNVGSNLHWEEMSGGR
jgi:hypothetical protein